MSLLGKTILIYGPAATGKTLLAQQLAENLRRKGETVVLQDDAVIYAGLLREALYRPEGTTTILTANEVPKECLGLPDLVIRMNGDVFAQVLVSLEQERRSEGGR